MGRLAPSYFFWYQPRFSHFLSQHERSHFHSYWSGWSANGQCLLVKQINQTHNTVILSFVRELYCLEHGIHPDGTIPEVSQEEAFIHLEDEPS